MITVSELSKEFNGFTAVDDVSFQVDEGVTLVLLGTSGSGKTTTLKMINRLIEPSSGTILIDGEKIQHKPAVDLRRHIGYVIQEIGLFPHYSVKENISVVPKLLGWHEDNIEDRIVELMNLVGLPPEQYLDRMPHELSGGQQQRVGFIRALAADPPIVLLDEPFGALDPITRLEIRNEFKQLETFLQKTMILVTHDVIEAFELGDTICLMDRGKVEQIGDPKDLLYTPDNGFVRNFLRSNRLQLEMQSLSLQDVIPHITSRETETEHLMEFPGETSVYEALESVENTAGFTPAIRILTESTETVYVSPRELLHAFYNTKQSLEQ